ncbi:MAG: hypothetical protein ABIN04_13710, partial [Ginsengibacter sp.]
MISVELVGTDHNPLPLTCTGSTQITGILKITVDQNATNRYGFRVFGDILVDGQFTMPFNYCDPHTFNSASNSIIYVESNPITWTCGTKLELRNLFVGWGNNGPYNTTTGEIPSGNACYYSNACDLGPHCAQLPLSPGGPPIIIITPLNADFSATGSCTASQTAQSYSFNALDATDGTTGGTPPYPSTAYSWTIVNKNTSASVGTMTGATPSFNFSPFGAGTYTVSLTVTDDNPTAVSTTSKDITVISCCTNPNAGTNGTLTVCSGITPTNAQLFARLGGSPATDGIWSGPVAGVYTYTVTATAPCTNTATSTVTVTEQAKPNAGTSGSLKICAGSTVTETQLFTVIGSHDAGTWSPTLAGAGTYTFTVKATSPCTTDATSTVMVTEQAKPNAGTSGTLTVCAGTTPTNTQLFAQLGGLPATGGIWSGPVSGVYTYTVAATAPCTVAATATVTVTTNPNVICATYNGDYFANTPSITTGGSAVINLEYDISGGGGSCQDISALTLGDINITYIKDLGINSVTLVPNSESYTNGVYQAQYTIVLSSSAYSGTVQFVFCLNNVNFAINSDCSSDPLVTVSTRVEGFVTGGGFIIPVNSGGPIGGSPVNGLKNNFGFNMKSNKKLQGNFNTILRRRENGQVVVYQVKSNVANSLVVTRISATSYRADMTFTSANFQNLTCTL